MKLALFAAIALSAVMAFFAVQNAQQAQVSFAGWYFNAPLVIILLLSFGAGLLTTLLATLPGSRHKSTEILRLQARLAESSSILEKFEKKPTTHKPESKETSHEAQR